MNVTGPTYGAVTLCIPGFNAGRYLSRILPAVMAQTYPIEEILVVDDDATEDNTAEVISNFTLSAPFPIRRVSAGYRTGLAHARNVGVNETATKFMASLDADCVPEPQWLETLMKKMEDEGVAGAGGMLIEAIQETASDRWRAVHMRQSRGNRRLVNPPFLYGHSNVYRVSTLREVGFYDEKYRTNAEDVAMGQKLRNAGFRILYEPDAVVRHLRTDTLASVLRARFMYSAYRIRKGPLSLTRRLIWHLYKGMVFIVEDLVTRRWSILPISLLYPFVMIILEINYRIKSPPSSDKQSSITT